MCWAHVILIHNQPQGMRGTGFTSGNKYRGTRPLVPQFAHDHHAYHEDAGSTAYVVTKTRNGSDASLLGQGQLRIPGSPFVDLLVQCLSEPPEVDMTLGDLSIIHLNDEVP